MNAISGQGMHPVAMEQDAALPAGTVIDSSLAKVRAAAAYVGVISRRYGQVPEDDEWNPERLSLTELEFREATPRFAPPAHPEPAGLDHHPKQRPPASPQRGRLGEERRPLDHHPHR
jgi:hypothetical protein